MKTARLAVLGVAAAAGLGAAYVMMGAKPPEPQVRVVAAPAPIVPTEAVLVASHDINIGSVLASADLRWQPWPKDQVPPGSIAQGTNPKGIDSVIGLTAQSSIFAGDPIHPERLGKGGGSMSALLPSGMRAVAIDLADAGKSAAGGFILPGDRVDVIRTFNLEKASEATSETILTDIRILAIGQSFEGKPGERTAVGGTATLEVTPAQAEKVIRAQRVGSLTLSLRSVADAKGDDPDKQAEQPQSMTVIRSGNASQTRVK